MIISYDYNMESIIIIVFYYLKLPCYSIARKKKTDTKEAKTMKKLEKFLEEYFEICAHK